ncbi:MAG: TolC family protein [Gemmatimonadota bacterium]|nr:MAG: TolC family protein [Gemmatimonadota bacterium]
MKGRQTTGDLGTLLGIVAFLVAAVPLYAQAGARQPEVYSLGRALNVALANSQTLKDTEMDLERAHQQVREAWSGVLPDIRGTASYTRNVLQQEFFLPARFFDPTAPPGELAAVKVGSDNTWQAGLSASQPLFEYTAFVGLGAAGRFKALQEERVRGTAQEVVTTVRIAYFNVLLAEESVRLIENSIERIRRTLEETQAMNRAGMASDYDVLLLEVQLSNLVPNLRRAEYDRASRLRALQVEMGLYPDGQIAVEGNLDEVDLADFSQNSPANAALLNVSGVGVPDDVDLGQVQQLALDRRSDIRQVRSNILLEEANLQAQKAEYFPSLSLVGNYSITAQQDGSPVFFGTSPNQRTSVGSAGVAVSLPIFTGMSRDARVQQVRANIRQTEYRLERLENQAMNELRTLMGNVNEARQRAASQKQAVAQAQRGFEIASAEYNAGIGSRLQTSEAELALRESEFNYAQAVYDYLVARAQLEMAVGLVPEEAGSFSASSDR